MRARATCPNFGRFRLLRSRQPYLSPKATTATKGRFHDRPGVRDGGSVAAEIDASCDLGSAREAAPRTPRGPPPPARRPTARARPTAAFPACSVRDSFFVAGSDSGTRRHCSSARAPSAARGGTSTCSPGRPGVQRTGAHTRALLCANAFAGTQLPEGHNCCFVLEHVRAPRHAAHDGPVYRGSPRPTPRHRHRADARRARARTHRQRHLLIRVPPPCAGRQVSAANAVRVPTPGRVSNCGPHRCPGPCLSLVRASNVGPP